jgi:hypothetical protein
LGHVYFEIVKATIDEMSNNCEDTLSDIDSFYTCSRIIDAHERHHEFSSGPRVLDYKSAITKAEIADLALSTTTMPQPISYSRDVGPDQRLRVCSAFGGIAIRSPMQADLELPGSPENKAMTTSVRFRCG